MRTLNQCGINATDNKIDHVLKYLAIENERIKFKTSDGIWYYKLGW